jgi:hypothetical protein
MIPWGWTSLLVRAFPPLGSPAGGTPPSQAPLLEHAAPFRGIPGQYGPADVDLIPRKALVPAAIQAMVGFAMANHRLNVRPQPLQALEPGRVGLRMPPLALGGNTDVRHLRRTQPGPLVPRMMHPATCLSHRSAKSSKRGGPARWACQARNLSDAASQLCGPPPGTWLRHSHRPGALRTQGCQNDYGLYTRAAAWRQRGAQSSRWTVRGNGGMGLCCFLFDTTAS